LLWILFFNLLTSGHCVIHSLLTLSLCSCVISVDIKLHKHQSTLMELYESQMCRLKSLMRMTHRQLILPLTHHQVSNHTTSQNTLLSVALSVVESNLLLFNIFFLLLDILSHFVDLCSSTS
jgi:hypothetical protein